MKATHLPGTEGSGVYWEALFDTAKGEQYRKALG